MTAARPTWVSRRQPEAERQIAEFWAAYEERNPSKREVAMVKYPERYLLKSDTDRIKEAQDLEKLMSKVPGRKVKRELAKSIVQALLGGKVSVEELEEINREIDTSRYTTSDPDVIIQAVVNGACGAKTASIALGFDEGE